MACNDINFNIWVFNVVYSTLLFNSSYMHVKLLFVLFLVIYHLLCHLIYTKQKNNTSKYTSNQLRIWNEVATLF